MGEHWITAEEAQARLGVKLQTLYAYASRGLVANRADDAEPRRSLYAADDIMRLTLRKARGRRTASESHGPLSWTEPAPTTDLTVVSDGRLFFRGRDAVELAERSSLEEVARLLWRSEAEDPFAGLAPHPPSVAGPTPRARGFSLLAHRAAHDPAASGRSPAALAHEAASLLADLVDAMGGQSRNGQLHERLARAWRVEGHKADMIRRALVLAVDHELNASTLAVRVAASTGAPLAAAALAGLATLSGPLHGGMAAQVAAFVAEARRFSDARGAAMQRLAQGLDVPGFGHPDHPSGDPRAAAIAGAMRYADDLAEIARAGEAVTGAAPNFDFALVAMARTLGLPADAPYVLTVVGRSVGWMAHAMEQRAQGAIRPRRAQPAGLSDDAHAA